jgi:hypothetical protein
LLIRVVTLLAALTALAAPIAQGAKSPAHREVTRSETVASPSACDAPAAAPRAYSWPVWPFDQQHPVRGNFGDPRIITWFGPLGSHLPGDVNYQFHNGVDIVAPDGSPVYPVLDGEVRKVGFDYVVVAGTRRIFQYWHIRPAVQVGERVGAQMTVLGTILPGAGHVHLTEIDDMRVRNPLAPGHLYPYRDDIPPVVDDVQLLTTDDAQVDPSDVHGLVEIVAQAHDESSMPVPGRWAGMPVTPAELTWTLLGAGGEVYDEKIGVDFRSGLPRPRRFWSVYANGTYQNWPVVDGRRIGRTPGRYLFRLGQLDAASLPEGAYTLRVHAFDVCGNEGTLDLPVNIVHGR